MQQARLIHASYLSDVSSGRNNMMSQTPRGLFRSIKPSTDAPANEGVTITEDNWSTFLEIENTLPSLIYFSGEPLEDVLAVLKTIFTPSSSEPPLLYSLFDKLELIVFSYMRDKHFDSFQKSPYHSKYLSFMTLSVAHVVREDFLLFRVLGRGGFGIVYGCKKCQSGHLYALKVMDRSRIKNRRAENLCITERNLLTMLDSPFIVGLKYSYETATEVHLVLEIMTGGDLGYHLRRKGIFNKLETMYYICRTILGIKTLHGFNIIFRDLKPDNILMDGRGRTALSDLGLAVVMPRNGLTGACGTRGYWAPEMLLRTPEGARVRYNLSVDWFSLGCVLYQFMAGVCPFRKMGDAIRRDSIAAGKEISKDEAIDKAVREFEPPYSPEMFGETAIDLIKKLLEKDGKKRLGAKGADEVMAHPFFEDINWQEYADDAIKPPCLPRKDLNYASQTEIGGFAPEEQAGTELSAADREVFSQWSYTRPSAFLEEVVIFMQHEEAMGPTVEPRPTPCSECCLIS